MPLLKSLELHGYKTFASRTQFEFPGNVTAIVGPNGSGKSNVADALRWVLGEQSYSLLRGRKTEDMIFSGSEFRPRAGMASATISFDNENGWLPIDFSEVTITRRAYRDGQNEYLLNGQRVRLKEITELLAQSGLAERTYTIIGQGLVDAALSLKPEERRRFFEEAAGIGLYRARREEALNRLDNTRRNLERVLDILTELEPRLHSLEKQARRAMEYEQVKADLKVLLRDWYGYHWHRTQQELVRTREVLHTQEDRLYQTRERLTKVEKELTTIRGQVHELRGQLNNWHHQSAEIHTRSEQVNRALAVMEERQRALLQQQTSARSDLARLEEELKARSERLVDLQEERDRLQGELDEAQERMGAARSALDARQKERAQIENKQRELRRILLNHETRQVQLRAHHNELTTRIETFRANMQGLIQAILRDGEDLQRAQSRLATWEKNFELSENDLKLAEEALQAHRQQGLAIEEQRRAAQDERGRMEAERSKLAAQLEVLEQAERSMTGLANGARFLIQEARQGRLRGGFRTLTGSLIVSAELETAVAAALGEYADSVLMDPGADLDRALEVLAKGDKGRAVLLPAEWVRPADLLTAKEDADCLGVAADMVQAGEDLSAAVRLLLGTVLVARNRQAARRMVSELPLWARVVTLQGEVFLGSGVVIAGQDQKPGVLGRTRKRLEYQEAVGAADVKLKVIEARGKELQTESDRLKAQEKDLETAVRTASQALSRAAQGKQQAVLEVEQARQKHEFQSRQKATMEAQIIQSEREATQAKQEMEVNTGKVSELNEQIREQNRLLVGMPLDELQAEGVHWNTTLAVAGRAVKEADRRVLEFAESIQAARRQAEAYQIRLHEAAASLENLETEHSQAQAQESALNDQIKALQQQIDPAEEKLASLENTNNQMQENMQAAQQAVAVAERYATQAQLDLTRHREALETLHRKIEEDFGLVSLEYNPDVAGQTPLPLEGMVEQLPSLAELPAELEDSIQRQRGQLRRMGLINPEVQSEYHSVKERFEFLTTQVADLKRADIDLREVIGELDELMRREFRKTFDAVAHEFKGMFTRLFGGGSARLILNDAENPDDLGIDIEAKLPGRRDQGLSLLSGGERSLTAVALIFSLLRVSPTPFCVMDEVDAMLDEANVGRFRDLLVELTQKTQFILVTHNRNTVQAADVIYGITMGRDSASQMISLRLDELNDEMVK
jgi:chromosome segregation protein